MIFPATDELLVDHLWNALVKYRADYCCERCGAKPEPPRRLVAHHKDWDDTNNRLDNGESLCAPCHNKEHHHNNDHVKGKNWTLSETAKKQRGIDMQKRWDDPEGRKKMMGLS